MVGGKVNENLNGQVRDTIATYLVTNPALLDPTYAWGRCLGESTQLARALTDIGVPTRLVRATGLTYPGREHWALALGFTHTDPDATTVVDVTVRQFDPDVDLPVVVGLADWCDLAVDWLNDAIRVEMYRTDLRAGARGKPLWVEEYQRDGHQPGPMLSPQDPSHRKGTP